MNRYFFIIYILSLHSVIYADSLEVGCASSIKNEEEVCSEKESFKEELFILEDLKEEKSIPKTESFMGKVRISKKIESIKFTYQKKEFIIERVDNVLENSCPPHCIEAMTIGKVKTVGELEVIDFIKSLTKKDNRLLVDVRSSKAYKQESIPGATNIPAKMLEKRSRYREEILTLLGAKKLQKDWYFKNAQKLLIFDNGIIDNQARKTIENLIKIGYPQNMILYYRGGVKSWKKLGLTRI